MDLHIAPFREDGVTYGTPTWIWSVAVGGTLYVRAYNGKNSLWYKAVATVTTAMPHIAIQEQLDGKVVEWMEKVSDEQYRT